MDQHIHASILFPVKCIKLYASSEHKEEGMIVFQGVAEGGWVPKIMFFRTIDI